MAKNAIIIGAGPAGLTAAYELLQRTEIHPIVLESEDFIGGLARTANYHGLRLDMGGHRFFSKSDRIMQWWQSFMPVQNRPSCDDLLLGRSLPPEQVAAGTLDPEQSDRVMLLRPRLSRIYFLRRFFNYPLSLNLETMAALGWLQTFGIGMSYLRSSVFPIRPETSLADFFTNRFGRRLYRLFFRDYTEKVWGVPCEEISAVWGAQRVKNISIRAVLQQAVKKSCGMRDRSVNQKHTESSLIEQFIYPKFGPGHFWETVADEVRRQGGEVQLRHRATQLLWDKDRIVAVKVVMPDGTARTFSADYCLSTMPVRDLIKALQPEPPQRVKIVGDGLVYRNFRTVGLLVPRLKLTNHTRRKTVNGLIPDTWIYIQDRSVKAGRLQVFNNWSPYLVQDWQHTVWLGVEYFCNENDDLWKLSDEQMVKLATRELEQIGVIEKNAVLDGCSFKMPDAYPAYFGTYDRFGEIQEYVDRFENLFLLGRNGMHRYNNMDHSMLTAMAAVDNIAAGVSSKENLWRINTEQEYHESE